MAKKQHKSRIPKSASAAASQKKPAASDAAESKGNALLDTLWSVPSFFNRELIESIVIAFVLAFLFRTFLAEAFVIPTGSMANTLAGRHKDVDCPKCGLRYRAGASSEVDNETGRLAGAGLRITDTQCPNCGYQTKVTPGNEQEVRHQSYSGDRILVGKFAYEAGLGEPERWDVAVFKFPGRSTVNYIKRLVGLPGEHLLIKNGNIYVDANESGEYQIARKSHDKLRAMMQPVHDNDFAPLELYKNGWPTRWKSDATGTKWLPSDDYRRYSTDGPANEPGWLRYRHTLAGKRQWKQLEGEAFGQFKPEDRPFLITDANAYNSSTAGIVMNGAMNVELEDDDPNNMDMHLSGLGMNWVSDLVLDCKLTVRSDAGQAIFELIDSGRQLHCTLDLETGRATLSIEGRADYAPIAQTSVQGPGTYAISVANVDDQLYLWVDGEPIAFDQPTGYADLGDRIPTAADLAPLAIGATGGAELEVASLKIHRDIYYIAMGDPQQFHDVDWRRTVDSSGRSPASRADFLSNSEFWRDQPHERGRIHKNTDKFRNARHRDFKISEDRFFLLGDNSARSADSRLWKVPDERDDPDLGRTVDRKLMIGKALFIYWPHSFNEIPGVGIPFPMFPNFGDMKFVK